VLDENYLDGTLIGDDVSEYCQQISINRAEQTSFLTSAQVIAASLC
jgi:hypothetical protein